MYALYLAHFSVILSRTLLSLGCDGLMSLKTADFVCSGGASKFWLVIMGTEAAWEARELSVK
jgi:hypothetical protein